MKLARPEAQQEFAGKRGGKPSPKQTDITERLVELAREGKRVLRLKGGDPFVMRAVIKVMAVGARGSAYAERDLSFYPKAHIPFRIVFDQSLRDVGFGDGFPPRLPAYSCCASGRASFKNHIGGLDRHQAYQRQLSPLSPVITRVADVPGITAGVGGLAYAGIPMTTRGTNTAITFITGHNAGGKVPDDINWEALANGSQALFLHGCYTLGSDLRKADGGRSASKMSLSR